MDCLAVLVQHMLLLGQVSRPAWPSRGKGGCHAVLAALVVAMFAMGCFAHQASRVTNGSRICAAEWRLLSSARRCQLAAGAGPNWPSLGRLCSRADTQFITPV